MIAGLIKKGFLLLLLIAGLCESALAMSNPAAVYCQALGYDYSVEEEDLGQRGVCLLPGDQKVSAWQFLQGKAAPELSYCREQGLAVKTVESPEVCITFLTRECAVCVLDNGTEVEVTRLMGLSFADVYCGDGSCHFTESHLVCPEDCPSGQTDTVCDGVIDGICDPDCPAGVDVDCAGPDIDRDGICTGFDAADYPNCRLAEVEGLCEPNTDLMPECEQHQSMPACETLSFCSWNEDSCEPYLEKLEECFSVKSVDNCTAADHCLWYTTDCRLCAAGPDNCPLTYNPDQADSDADGWGDVCDPGDTPGPTPTTTTSIPDDTVTTSVSSSDTTTTVPPGETTTTTTILPPPPDCPVEALYGKQARETVYLKRFRDDVLSKTPAGRRLIRLYYLNRSTVRQALQSDEKFNRWMQNQIERVLPLIEKTLGGDEQTHTRINKLIELLMPIIDKSIQTGEDITRWAPGAVEKAFPLLEQAAISN